MTAILLKRATSALLLTIMITSGWAPSAGAQSTTSRTTDGYTTWTYSDDEERYRIEARGDVRFTDDDSGVKSISDGGYLDIDVRESGRRVELRVRPDSRGNLTYDYRVNGRQRDYDAAARRETADLFLMVIRESGVNADERTGRILRAGGTKAVLDEIDEIRSQSAVARYVLALIEQADLDRSDLARVADITETRVKSSGSKSRILIEAAPAFMEHEELHDRYFDLARTVPSSGDRMRIMLTVLDMEPDRDTFLRLIDVTAGIPSSGDRTRVLTEASGSYAADPAVRTAFFEAVNSIPSSGDRTRLLIHMLTRYEMDEATVAKVFESVESVPSSGDKSRILLEASRHYMGSDVHRERFFNAVRTIPSSGDRSRVLITLMESHRIDEQTLLDLLAVADGIPSSGDQARVLSSAIGHVDTDAEVDAYLNVANSIPSESERSRAISALMRRN